MVTCVYARCADLLHVEKRHLSEKEMMSIAMQIADAMQFMHMANIVHRDLKPSNCLVSFASCYLPETTTPSQHLTIIHNFWISLTWKSGSPSFVDVISLTWKSGSQSFVDVMCVRL